MNHIRNPWFPPKCYLFIYNVSKKLVGTVHWANVGSTKGANQVVTREKFTRCNVVIIKLCKVNVLCLFDN